MVHSPTKNGSGRNRSHPRLKRMLLGTPASGNRAGTSRGSNVTTDFLPRPLRKAAQGPGLLIALLLSLVLGAGPAAAADTSLVKPGRLVGRQGDCPEFLGQRRTGFGDKKRWRAFYEDHFRWFSRQIVLVDVLRALLAGREAFEDTRLAIEAILQSFRYGSGGICLEAAPGPAHRQGAVRGHQGRSRAGHSARSPGGAAAQHGGDSGDRGQEQQAHAST